MAKGQEGDNGEQQRLSQVDPEAASSSLRLGEAGGGLSKRMSLNRPCWRSGESPFVPSGSRAFVPNHHHPFPLSFASKAYLLYSKHVRQPAEQGRGAVVLHPAPPGNHQRPQQRPCAQLGPQGGRLRRWQARPRRRQHRAARGASEP